MKNYLTLYRALACSGVLLAAALPSAASARVISDGFAFAPTFSVAHKLKKQSTGSTKRLSQKHDHIAKQKKEKKWHKKAETPGQGSFSPKKYRK